jgi:hypothetical protein
VTQPEFETSSWGGRRYLPHAFTEEGIAMLSSVLRSERAAFAASEDVVEPLRRQRPE